MEFNDDLLELRIKVLEKTFIRMEHKMDRIERDISFLFENIPSRTADMYEEFDFSRDEPDRAQ